MNICFHADTFQQNWRGIMLADAFQTGRTKLVNLFDCSLRNLPMDIHVAGSWRGLQWHLESLCGKTEVDLNASQFRLMTLRILFEVVLFNSDASSSRSNQHTLISKLDYLLHCLMDFHTLGTLPTDGPNSKEIVIVTLNLLEPILLYEIEQSAIVEDNYVDASPRSQTLISHLLATKTALEKEDEGRESIDFSFLTTSHLAHTLFEIFLIAEHALSRSLHVMFAALAQRSDWYKRLTDEIASHQKDCLFRSSDGCDKHTGPFTVRYFTIFCS